MKKYRFQTKEFGVSEGGLHFLRGGYNYKSLSFDDIQKTELVVGKELHNWTLILFIGLLLFISGLYMSIGVLARFVSEGLTLKEARLILLLSIPVVGAYFIYTACSTGPLLKIYYGDGMMDKFPLRVLVKDNQLKEFVSYLKDKTNLSTNW